MTEGRDCVECATHTSAETIRRSHKKPPLRPRPSIHQTICKGVDNYREGLSNEAIAEFKTALKMLNNGSVRTNAGAVALVLGNLGAVYLEQNKLFLASEALQEALRKAATATGHLDKYGQLETVGKIHNNIGNICFIREEYGAALEHYNTALEIYEASSAEPIEYAHILFNVARVYVRQKQWDDAIMLLEACNKVEKDTYRSDDVAMARTLELMGFCHLSKKGLEPALCHFSDALLLEKTAHGSACVGVARNLYNIGMVREAREQPEQAFDMYGKSADILKLLGIEEEDKQMIGAKRSAANVRRHIYQKKEMENYECAHEELGTFDKR